MQLSDDLQSHLLGYLSDRQLVELAGPRGLGREAFNRLYRHVVVESGEKLHPWELAIGTADFSASAARRIFGARSFVAFCQRHPHYRPHIVEFPDRGEYVEVDRLAPQLLANAAELWLEWGANIFALNFPSPAMFSNIRHYTVVSKARFEEYAKTLAQQLPQLEQLTYWNQSPSRVAGTGATHEVDFDHPSLRWLSLSSPSVDFNIVRLPDSVRELKAFAAKVRFTERFDYRRSGLMKLIGFEFQFPAASAALLRRLEALEFDASDNADHFGDVLASQRLRSLCMRCMTNRQFSRSSISADVTVLDLKLVPAAADSNVVFELAFPALRELSVGYSDKAPGLIAFSGRFPASLERLSLSACSVVAAQRLHTLPSLRFLRLDRCSCDLLGLPPGLVECEIEHASLQELELPPPLKRLALDNNGECEIMFNDALESLSFTVRAGRQYHDLPNLHTLRFHPPKDGRFIACAATISLPRSLASLEMWSVDASRLELPSSLIDVRMPGCGLTEFPALPRLESLDVSKNQIYLPCTLPPRLSSLDVTGNVFPKRLDWSQSKLRVLVTGKTDCKIAVPATIELNRSTPPGPMAGRQENLKFAMFW